jgi:hypothetical protein
MNPTYLKEIIQLHSILQGQINQIENILYPAIQKALEIRLELIRKFNSDHKNECLRFPHNFYVDGIDNIECINSDSIVVDCFSVGDANELVRLPIKIISDFFFDRPAFEKFFVDEHEKIVNKYFQDKFAEIDAARKANTINTSN